MPMKCPGIAVACIALQLLLCYSAVQSREDRELN